ncbi:hypothetical protein DFJ43DRAFT_1223311 [Lentinula guzmanii]|uniref:Uncharacterized protein n=1 Tax=Lentinula guzmanii TaxID=2804957 RepID=A0AA38JI58_9AGAR|nr:hypothetical protein DFJ43DRAFT_1223311 [Lentinula guzmanii]
MFLRWGTLTPIFLQTPSQTLKDIVFVRGLLRWNHHGQNESGYQPVGDRARGRDRCVAASDALDNNEDVNLPIDDLDEDVLELAAALMIQKVSEIEGDGTRVPYNQFPKSQDWFSTSLQQPDRWFRSNHRMSWNMFDRLVFILTPNAVFHSPKKKQWHVKYQLVTFLIRYG